jgi:hypothetical protein
MKALTPRNLLMLLLVAALAAGLGFMIGRGDLADSRKKSQPTPSPISTVHKTHFTHPIPGYCETTKTKDGMTMTRCVN